jgi:prolyl-tRNA synthetase
VHLIATGKEDSVFDSANNLAQELTASNIKVIYDDRRGVSPGVKFNDSELLGMPIIVVVGKKLSEGLVEIKNRKSGVVQEVALATASKSIIENINQLIQETI